MSEENTEPPMDFCVPIYLNQQIVFDLLAIMEDGFTQISSITKTQNETDRQESETGGSIGISNVFAFLGVSFNAHDKDAKSQQTQEACAHQKVHTPTSLFSKLRHVLYEKKVVKEIRTLEDIKNLNSGEFVEFKAVLRKNPLVEIFEMMRQILELASAFKPDSPPQSKKPGSKPDRNAQDSNEKIKFQLDLILKNLNQSNSLEILGELLTNKEVRAVLSTKIQYFTDRNSNDIIDGEFRVLGKVVRVIRVDSKDSINLLRKTSFGKLDNKILDAFCGTLDTMKASGMKTPEFIAEINGPAFQIIPIAIFT